MKHGDDPFTMVDILAVGRLGRGVAEKSSWNPSSNIDERPIVATTEDPRAPRPARDGFHTRLYQITPGALSSATAQTNGMTRVEAISRNTVGSSGLWMGQTHVSPSTRSANHHHGRSETGIYVVSGAPVFVFLDGDTETRLQTRPGDYIYVPPWVPHREENLDPDNEAVVVIARNTQEAVVVNVPSLRWSPPVQRMPPS
jgi:uncharacterized RmlC-like cupin family protein